MIKVTSTDANILTGIGTTAPTTTLTVSQNASTLQASLASSQLHLAGADAAGTSFLLDNYGSSNTLNVRRSNGTASIPSSNASGSVLFQLVASGYGTTQYLTNSAAKISVITGEAWTDTTGAAFISFSTRPSGTTGASTERVRIFDSGGLAIGITSNPSSLAVKPRADFVATGTSSTNASTTIVGVGTRFLSEIGFGDRISLSSVPGTFASVTNIASDTSLTIDAALGNGTSQTINVKKSVLQFRTIASAFAMMMDDQGNIGINKIPTLVYTLEVNGTISSGTGNDATSGVIAIGTRYINSATPAGFYSSFGTLRGGGTFVGDLVGPDTANSAAYVSTTNVASVPRAAIEMVAGIIKFKYAAAQTTAFGSSVTMTESMRIFSSGVIGLGTGTSDGVNWFMLGGGNTTPISGASTGCLQVSYTAPAASTSNIKAITANAISPASTAVNRITVYQAAGSVGAAGSVTKYVGYVDLTASTHIASASAAFSDTQDPSGNFFIYQNGTDSNSFNGTITVNKDASFNAINPTGTNRVAAYSASNTSGQMTLGLESSVGGNLFVGASAYSVVLGTGNARSLHLATSNTVRFTVDSTGAVTATGLVTASAQLTTNIVNLNGANGVSPPGAGLAMIASTAASGLQLIGNGSTDDIIILNSGGSTALHVPHGTVNVSLPGQVTISGNSAITAGSTLTFDNNANILWKNASAVSRNIITVNPSNILFMTGADAAGVQLCYSNGNVCLSVNGNTSAGIQFNNYGAGTLTTNASGIISATSDERLKEDIQPYLIGLSEVVQLSPKSYKWKKGTDLEDGIIYAGFIAQEVEPFIPEAIGQDPTGMLSLNDRPILAALVNAIKELKSDFDAYKASHP